MTTESEVSSATAVPLTRAEKEKLLTQMYRLSHWIDLIRLFGYQTLPMAKAREAIKPLAERYGKEPVASACETMVEISMHGQEAFARLKPHIRRMAFQILGPEPTPNGTSDRVASEPPAPAPQTETERPGRTKNRKPKAPDLPPKPSTPPAKKQSSPEARGTIMQQYHAAKKRHPDMLLLFRMGDFFELFGQDAEIAHKLLGLTLTTRDRMLTMAGFPHHQLEVYLHKLLKEGQRVAICEPVEESLARGSIRREVTRVVTPGNMIEDDKSCAAKSPEEMPEAKPRPVRQPRHFVLKEFEKWLNESSLAFVAVDDVRRTTPAVAPYVGVLDFIVLRGDEKLLATLRPRLHAKHLRAIRELQKLLGSEYKPIRVWPSEGPTAWNWDEYPVDVSAAEAI